MKIIKCDECRKQIKHTNYVTLVLRIEGDYLLQQPELEFCNLECLLKFYSDDAASL